MSLNQTAPNLEGIELELQNPLFEYVRYTEFKRILGQIALNLDRDGYNSIAVLSEFPGEGRTFFVSALALGYALLLGRKVLVVNTATQSQYRSLFHQRVFSAAPDGPSSPPGESPVRPTIDLISPFDGEQQALPISSDFKLGQYIKGLKNVYDLVLYDTCALSVSNKNNVDPIVIARQADSSILLTSDRSTSRDSMALIGERFKQWNIRLMGAVHNSRTAKLDGRTNG